ncbi:hypothetical protein [Evansella tamaricis]|uniref:Uncharacterized protein n=1 Tax=Evansella tamaricis TaxID=2069301 RepID=A0ABS6JGS7_9BACI|nr:hypothetical protein [Evansella tamaricis]MBU9712836.1 hypothetical protein [Evansella tamaricis]
MSQKDQILDVYIDRLFKKHNISTDKIDLSGEEKNRMRGIIENIQSEVENFLENAETVVTENDMPNNLNNDSEEAEETYSESPKNSLTSPKVYVRNKRKN